MRDYRRDRFRNRLQLVFLIVLVHLTRCNRLLSPNTVALGRVVQAATTFLECKEVRVIVLTLSRLGEQQLHPCWTQLQPRRRRRKCNRRS